MKRKCLFTVALICSLGLTISGCAQDKGLALTQQDQQLVTSYAASVLMKYNSGSNMRLLSGMELVNAEAEDLARREREAKRQQRAAQYTGKTKQEQAAAVGGQTDTSSQDRIQSESQTAAVIEDLGGLMALEGIKITYQSYELTDSYGAPDAEIMMAMDASPGKTLLVAHFSVVNEGDSTEHLDVLSREGKFRLKADGRVIQAQYTLLLNDLSMYKGDIEPGASIDTVLVFEVTQEQADAQNLELAISMDGQSGSVLLK